MCASVDRQMKVRLKEYGPRISNILVFRFLAVVVRMLVPIALLEDLKRDLFCSHVGLTNEIIEDCVAL